MANEIIGKSNRLILVQINNNTSEERVMYQDYNGMLQPTISPSAAKSYQNKDDAEKIASTFNMLYQLTGQPYTLYVVDETIERVYADEQAKPSDATDATDNAEITQPQTKPSSSDPTDFAGQ